MRTKLTLLLVFCVFLIARADVIIQDHYKDQNVNIPTDTEVHLTSATAPLINSTVNLVDETSWLYFDNIRPVDVLANYSNSILINGATLESGVNARVTVYKQGTVVIPHKPDYQPLEVFTEKNFSGNSQKYGLYTYYKGLDGFDNKIRSFKLKKGYMATLAAAADGTGYSKIYIAESEDLLVQELPKELDMTVSFIRTFAWQWPSKKGWCGTGSGSFNDAQKTNSTWTYSWSADLASNENVEWAPMRHNMGWPGWDQIGAVTNSTHLLGFNEPDRDDQALMTVEQAIAQWPEMLKTGLRLGSPAPSAPGNGNNWLYRFIDKCDSLNYRVDYVAVHCYWGNKSPSSWYNDLKYVHQRTGRPLWITEWNNGANWTNESWPSDVAGQQQKQLNDLKGILQVLDTASFIERYSIYNWVEDKRAIVLNGNLTPAGEYYRDNKSVMAFNKNKEVDPHWNLLSPQLTLQSLTDGKPNLVWSDSNEGLIDGYELFRKEDDATAEKRADVANSESQFQDTDNIDKANRVSYSLKMLPKFGESPIESNEVQYFISNANANLQYGKTSATDNQWYFHSLKSAYDATPTVLFGTQSNNSNTPMSMRVKSLTKTGFQFHFDLWSYLEADAFPKSENIAYALLPEGKHDLGGIKVQTGTAKSIGASWLTIKFAEPFDVIPVVFTTQIVDRAAYPTTVCIRNVTKEGFEVSQKKEMVKYDETSLITNTNINYWAVTPGSAVVNGQKINVGITEENAVAGIYSAKKITFHETIENPLLFCSMQTSNDTYAATLKYNSLTNESVNVFKQRENSKGGNPNSATAETVGWMVIEDVHEKVSIGEDEYSAGYQIYPNPVKDILNIAGTDQSAVDIVIFDLTGKRVLAQTVHNQIDLSVLSKGCYILQINNNTNYRLVKE